MSETKVPERTPEEIITDKQLIEAWGNADFGDIEKREVVIQSLKKAAQGWAIGNTIWCILKELDLACFRNGNVALTEKGLEYLLSYAKQPRK